MGNHIKEWREAQAMTQEQLANLIGTDKSMVGRLENGQRRLTVKWLDAIAKALTVRPADLLNDAWQDRQEQPVDARRIWFLKHMEPDNIDEQVLLMLASFMGFMRGENYAEASRILDFIKDIIEQRRKKKIAESLSEIASMDIEFLKNFTPDIEGADKFYNLIFNIIEDNKISLDFLGLPALEVIKSDPSLWPALAFKIFEHLSEAGKTHDDHAAAADKVAKAG